MQNRRLIRLIVTGFVGVSFGLIAQTNNASANKAARVIEVTNIKNTKVHLTKGSIYSSDKLTKVLHNGKNYQHATFVRYTQATVKKSNGKTAIYQYIKSGKVKGWIWHSYLKDGAAPKVATSQTTKAGSPAIANTSANQSAFAKSFLNALNKERAKKNLPTMTESVGLNKVAQTRAVQITQDFCFVNADGQLGNEEVGKELGISVNDETFNSILGGYESLADIAESEVHDDIYKNSDVKNRDQAKLLNSGYTKFGAAFTYDSNGKLYTVQEYSK